jgi:hypothetical protein
MGVDVVTMLTVWYPNAPANMYFQNGLQHSGVEYLFITFPRVGVAEYLKYLFSD